MSKPIDFVYKFINHVKNRYFLHNTVKGIIYLATSFLASFFLLLLVDLSFNFNGIFTQYIKGLYGIFLFGLFVFFVFQPIFYWTIYKGKYTKEWFAKVIGNQIPEIDDKITNVLELQSVRGNTDLINASIEQKSFNIDVSKLKGLFPLKTLLKSIILFSILLSIFILIYLIVPEAIKYSSSRILPFQNTSVSLPYEIKIENDNFNVKKGENFRLKVSTTGSIRPSELFVQIGASKFQLNDSLEYFVYSISNVRQDLNFKIFNYEYVSETFHISCIPVPGIKNIELRISPPSYTSFPVTEFKNSGNITVPYGSTVTWNIHAVDTDSLLFTYKDSIYSLNFKDGYAFQQRVFTSNHYGIIPVNNLNSSIDTFYFHIKVKPDLYPELSLKNQTIDGFGNFQFAGVIRDDFGFKDFHLILKSATKQITTIIPIQINSSQQSFLYRGSLLDYVDSIENDNIELYLKLRDNDPFYPYKSTQSISMYGNIPNSKNLSEIENKQLDKIQEKLTFGQEILQHLQKEKKNIQNRLFNENLSDWERDQLINDLKNNTAEIQKVANEINSIREELKQIPKDNSSDALMEKKEFLDKLLSQLMDEDLKNLLNELKELQEKLKNKNDFQNSDDIDFSMDDMEKQLDRNIEMLKRFEVEKNQEEIVEELKELADQFQKTDSTSSKENLDALHNQMEELFKKHEENIKKNSELESPLELDEFKNEKNSVLQKSEQFKDDGGKEENNPSDDLESLAEAMQNNMEMALQQEDAESAELIREILENLILFSFEQETLIYTFQELNQPDNSLRKEQLLLKERFTTIQDSLQSIMLRNVELAGFIGTQLKDINIHFDQIHKKFSGERYSSIIVSQQTIMQNINELVVMMQESLKNMESNMSGKGGNCDKPGKKKKPGMSRMKKQQESFKKSLQEMIDGLKKGEKGQKGQQGTSEQLSKMLGAQEKMQQMLQQMMQSGEVGQKAGQKLKEINKIIDQNIDDILNRNISDKMFNRQNEILSRMLEAEKAEEEREKDDKRESKSVKNQKLSNPGEILEYKGEEKIQRGIIFKPDIPLKYFFQRKYDNYLNNMENN